ncbi:MaoC/PaaZ C-terminal domain-containing protein [Nocardiopsis coralliicola]
MSATRHAGTPAAEDRAAGAQRTAGGVRPGDALPPLEIPVTRTLVVAAAIASRDFQDVHHDQERAVASGSRDVFLNILTTNGLVDRFVTAWAGPAAALTALKIRLGTPAYPGDTLVFTGEVASADADGRVVVAVRCATGAGAHAWGTAEVRLPAADSGQDPEEAP